MDEATLDALNRDLIGEGGELLEGFFKANPNGVKAWDFVRAATGTNSAKRLSIDILESVSKHLEDADFMTIIGNGNIQSGKNAFGELINKYAGKCQACTGGNPSQYLPDNPQEYIEKVVELTKRYSDKNGVDIFKEAKKGFASQEGAWFAMKKIEKLDPEKVSKIDAKFEDLPDDICNNCRFDVLMINGTKMEFKSWGKVGVDLIASQKAGSSFYKQFISYISDASTDAISKIEYHFELAKLTELADPKDYIAGKFKTFFKENSSAIFDSNPDLWKQFDRIGGGKIDDVDDFIELINHISFNSSHPILNFIKI